MMRRFSVAILLLTFTVLFCIIGLIYIKNQKNYYSDFLYSAYEKAKNGDYEGAEKTVKDFSEKWAKAEKKLMIFVNRNSLDDITFTTRLCEEYIVAKELPEFYAETKKVLALLDHALETEMPVLENIL